MARRLRTHSSSASRSTLTAFEVASATVLCIAAVVVPTLVAPPGIDSFRLPKELAFVAMAILVSVVGIFAATSPRTKWSALFGVQREILLTVAIVGWTIVTTFTSTNRGLSVLSLVTVICAAVLFIAVCLTSPRLPIAALDVLLAVACINTVVACLQEYGVWNPFQFPPNMVGHQRTTALIGNANDFGSYLVAPALAAVIAALASRGTRRWIYWAASALLALGLIVSSTRTALIAYGAALLVFAFSRSWRQATVILLILAGVAAAITIPSTSVGQSLVQLITGATQRRYDVLLSERLPPFLSAIEIGRAHPILGAGPGCFKFQYMNARIAINAKYPPEWTRGWPMNFAETHNDHLQVFAETGLPGYALFLASVMLLAFPRSRRAERNAKEQRHAEQTFARTLRLPLATALFVLALAQFPLQLAAPRLAFLALAGLCVAWDRNDAP